jgi:circadian clock protein KaiC
MTLRVRSGIEGLDEVLGGGFLRKRCVIISGGPGSGKTTLCTQFLYRGLVDYGEPGVYVALAESPDEIRQNAKSLGLDLEEIETKKGLRIIDGRPVLLTEAGLITPNEALFKGEVLPFSHILNLVLTQIRSMKAKRVVIDSLTVLTMQYVNKFYIRQGLFGLVQALAREDCVSLLTLETIGEQNIVPIEWAVVQGVISLNYERKGGDMARSIQIMKMRGSKHGERVYSMEIGDKGLVIHPEVTVPL